MCVDYRKLNTKTTNKGTYMLSRIDDTLDSLHRANFLEYNLRIVLKRIRAARLKLKPSKCSLFQLETNYLGHVISADGVKTDPKKVQDVKIFARPRNVKDVRVFMDMTRFYSKFIKDFMIIAVPLYKLMQKGVKFE